MNIQIFGVSKSADTRKAERYFKERRIKFQSVDMKKYGMSGGEFDSVLRAVGGVENLIDWDSKSPDLDLIRYMADPLDKEDKLFENQLLIRMPLGSFLVDFESGGCLLSRALHDTFFALLRLVGEIYDVLQTVFF